MPEHLQLLEWAKEAINKVHDDETVEREVVIVSLRELEEKIEVMLDALET